VELETGDSRDPGGSLQMKKREKRVKGEDRTPVEDKTDPRAWSGALTITKDETKRALAQKTSGTHQHLMKRKGRDRKRC